MTFISYAQNFEDVLLWRALGTVDRGFYIDVGAHHPDRDSVTRAFYDRGWSGVNIEPLSEEAARLRAARPRDVTLQLAVGASASEAPFYVIEGTGLSTLDGSVAASYDGSRFPVRETRIPVLTLAEICMLHGAPEIHFLKIDVEGAELAVLQGADFVRYRPWIVLAEATAPLSSRQIHQAWEPLLLDADYLFVWFDGLNRYYVARERAETLAPHFGIPPNVFDNFRRAGDDSWIGRVVDAEGERDELRRQAVAARTALEQAADRAQRLTERVTHDIARLREAILRSEADAERMRVELHATHQRLALSDTYLGDVRCQLQESRHELQQTHLRLQGASAELEAVWRSRSWKITAPMRAVLLRARGPADNASGPTDPVSPAEVPRNAEAPPVPGQGDSLPAVENEPELQDAGIGPVVLSPPPPFRLPSDGPSRPFTAVHQFHSGSAVHDAITNAMLLTRSVLRSMGYDSEIYTEKPPEALAHELRPLEAMPRHDRYVLIVHHSMGYDRFQQILDLPARKILLYHNITPPELLARHPHLARYAALGRQQLGAFRGRIDAALADSEYNAAELRRLGISPVRTCTLLFDIEALRRRAVAAADQAAAHRQAGLFTILFVGRINASKNQVALVEAYAAFREAFAAPSRLVLVGRGDGPADPYGMQLTTLIETAGLASHVVVTGGIDDAALDAWYGAADLYVSLSRHEGFGVPLVEAAVHGVSILAYPSGAVPYTLGGASTLLVDERPASVASAMLALATNPAARGTQAAAQSSMLQRFALDRQRDVLQQALLSAGAAPPADPAMAALLEANLRVSIAGHVNGSYSLAAINRDLATALDAALPGRVRLLPVEGAPTLDLSGVPADEAPAIAALVHRPPHPTGPAMLISQHYPVYVPQHPADISVAMLFWEESRLPPDTIDRLGQHFQAVVAPTRFVRDALIGSGLAIPVRVIPPALRLEPFVALRAGRTTQAPGSIHRFLHVSSCFPRKGVDVLLRAWSRSFRAGDPVRLTIKGFPNIHNEVAADLDALRAADPDMAPVELIDRDLGPDALLALYADADTMVLPTRGEGYNLPAAEALAAGLGLVVTGGGGHMDFCTQYGSPLPGVRLLGFRPERSRSHLASAHSLWLEPDEDDLVAALRERLDGSWPMPPLPLVPDAAALARDYVALGRDLLLAPPPRPFRISWVSSWDCRCGVAEYSRQLLDGFAAMTDAAPHVRVLCDRRTGADVADAGRFWPCWNLGDPDGVEALAAAIEADDAPAVMLQHQPGLLAFGVLARLIGHPALHGRVVMATLHNTWHLLDLGPDELSATVAGLRRLDRVLVHTVADLVRLQSLGLVDNASLLPHGVRSKLLPQAPRDLRNDVMSSPVIGCYGFFLPGKGIDTLIDALSILIRRWPDARLLLINAEYDHPESREEIDRCLALVEARGLSGRIVFETGFLPHHDSIDRLAGCDVIALPYRPSKEASSAALRGAMSAGVPVAVTPIALFDEADAAVFRFEGTDADAVARGLERLLDDADLRRVLQGAAQSWLAARQWPDIARGLCGMIAGLVRTREIEQPGRSGS